MRARTVFVLCKGFTWLAIGVVVHSGLGKYAFAQAPGASLCFKRGVWLPKSWDCQRFTGDNALILARQL